MTDYFFVAAEIVCKEPGGQDALKTQTALLLDKGLNFLAFGSKALDMFYERDDGHLLFEKFKMDLHGLHSLNVSSSALNGYVLF